MAKQWAERASTVDQQFRQSCDNSRAVQRVQVAGAVDRWVQDSIRTATTTAELRDDSTKVDVWLNSSANCAPRLELHLAEILDSRRRAQLVTELQRSFQEAGQQKTVEVGAQKSAATWDVVLPSILSLAAGMGLVRAFVVVLDYAGIRVHGWWWLAVAGLVGGLFTTGMVLLRLHQRQEKLRMTMAMELRRELDHRVQEIVTTLYFSGVDPHGGGDAPSPPVPTPDVVLPVTPRRVAVARSDRE